MISNFCRKLVERVSSFVLCQKGVTAIEYAIVAVGMAAIVLLVFNPSTGPFYDAMINARDAIVAAIENNT